VGVRKNDIMSKDKNQTPPPVPPPDRKERTENPIVRPTEIPIPKPRH
jgi:hypothetical protein